MELPTGTVNFLFTDIDVLDDPEFERGYDQGRQLTLEQAVEQALAAID